MITIDCTVEGDDWADQTTLSKLSHEAIEATIPHCGGLPMAGAEVSIVFSSDKDVQALNKQWRNIDKATNVLSFATNEGDGPQIPLLGDIVLAFETIKKEARTQEKRFDDHLTHLIIHGFLHLLGHDHISDDEADIMEAIEVKALSTLGIADPYTSI